MGPPRQGLSRAAHRGPLRFAHMDKLLWVLLPIVLAGAAVAVAAWRGRLPPRPVLNAGFSLLLLVYLLVTAGLGIFWVAHQHLPVFDWHYVFGYALLLLVVVHLGFNLRALRHHLRRGPPPRAGTVPAIGRRPWLGGLGVLGVAAAAGLGYAVGLRHGRTELRIDARAAPAGGMAWAVVEEFHAFSAHTRQGVLRRAPGADWGAPPPPFKPPRPGAARALPVVAGLPPGAPTGALDDAALARLLWHTVGVSARAGGIHFRTSPSSGALFATELYLLTCPGGAVPAGLWHYDVPGHALQPLAPAPAAASLPGVGELPPDAVALLVATALFRRSGHKYRDRTYRYVLGDLGHALENLRVAALREGLQPILLPAFDEQRIAAALGVDEAEEGVLAVMLLQRPAPATRLPPLQPAAWQPPPLAATGPERLGLTHAIHRATSLRRLDDGPAVHSGPALVFTPLPAGVVSLPESPSAIVDPLPLIARRRSVRRYARTPLALADLAGVLSTMARPAPQLSAAVRIDVMALAVEGLPPGAWRYHPTAHALEPRLRHGEDLRRRARAAGLDQDVIGEAAAVLVLSIDRTAIALDAAGAARGYRQAFLESGLVGERVYLEAGARGLGACAVGAFYDDEAAALAGTRPGQEWVVHFAALGVVA